MAAFLPNGTKFYIASAYGASKSMTAVTNASTAEATLEATHGVTEGDIIEITSGWGALDGRVVMAGTVDTNDVLLDGIDTSNLTRFPAGEGIGSVREISTWVQIKQILESNATGGEQQFMTFSYLEEESDRQMPTRKSAAAFTLSIADDPSLAFLATVEAADDAVAVRAVKAVLPNGNTLLYNGYVSITDTPTLTKDQVMSRMITVSLVAPPTRYAA